MSQYKKKKKKTQNYELLHGSYGLIPLLAVIFLVPLIVRLYCYDSNLSGFDWFPSTGSDEIDVFLYWKSRVFTLLGAVMCAILIFKLTNRKFRQEYKKTCWLYPLAAYGILALLSTLFSEYRSFGLSGIHEQFESVWVVLSYCVLTFFAYAVVQSAADLASVRRAVFALLVVLCLLGFTQMLGKDFWESSLGWQLMAPEKYSGLRDSISFNFSGSGIHQVYLTFYNPNYVGMFAALILPFSVFCIFSLKKWWEKLLWSAVSIGLLVCTFNSGSKTFLISIAVSAVAALVLCRRAIRRRIAVVIPACIALIIAGVIYMGHIGLNPFTYVKNALTLEKNDYKLEDIQFTENDVTVRYNGAALHVMYAANDAGAVLICTDESGTVLEYTMDEEGCITLTDTRFSGMSFRFSEGNAAYPWLVSINIREASIYFTQTDTGYRYINNVGKFAEAVKAPSAVFTDYDSFASYRGYLWSRTIPLLRDSLVLGTGADTFSLVFPQNDLVGRVNAGFYNSLITKPHNLYLQIGVQHGVPALLCFLAVCVIYLIQSFPLYWKADFSEGNHWLGAGVMLGIIGYLIAGLSNDSCIAIAPLFWAMLGIGFAVNRLNRAAADTRTAAAKTAGAAAATAAGAGSSGTATAGAAAAKTAGAGSSGAATADAGAAKTAGAGSSGAATADAGAAKTAGAAAAGLNDPSAPARGASASKKKKR